MDQDPSYLSHLGELATPKNALSCWFYQGALDNGGDLQSMAREIGGSHSPDDRLLLCAQIETLLTRSDEEIIALWDSCTGYTFQSPSDARFFFRLFAEALGASGHVA